MYKPLSLKYIYGIEAVEQFCPPNCSGHGGNEGRAAPPLTSNAKEKSIDKVSSSLSNEEIDLVREYSAGSDSLNSSLRFGGELSGYDKKQSRALDAAFKKCPGSPQDTTLYRAVDDLGYIPAKGSVFIDKGYVSTCMSKPAFKLVTEEMKDFGVDQPVKIQINVPKGAKILPIQGKLSTGYFDHQDEGLLSRGTKFKVLSRTRDEVILQVVP